MRLNGTCATVIGCLILLVATPAFAQIPDPVMQICGGGSPTTCFPAPITVNGSSFDIGGTTSTNPSFAVTNNDGGTTASVVILALVPNSTTNAALTFSVTFSQGSTSFTLSPGTGTAWTNASQSLLGAGGLFSNLGQAPGPPNGGPPNYKINGTGGAQGADLSAIQTVPGVTSYRAWQLQSCNALGACLGTAGPSTGSQKNVTVSFSNFSGFPPGTIFLALGLDSNGNTLYSTPLTVGEEVVTNVPEPGTLSLLAFGIFGLALLARHRHDGTPPQHP